MEVSLQRLAVLASVLALGGVSRPAQAVPCDQTVHPGQATYYDFADGTGVCGYPAETGNQMVVALDAPELADTALCGACIHAWGPSGEVTVLVVNGCPECGVGHLDLSPQAYALIAAGYNGVPPITWQYVPCDVSGPIKYAYFQGSTTNWAWVQIRNHRHPIATFEARTTNGTFEKLERSNWGYFKAVNLPPGGQTYRVTDIYGQVLEDTGIAVLDQGEVPGQAQFPPCSGVDAGVLPAPDGSAGQDSAPPASDGSVGPATDGSAGSSPTVDSGAAVEGGATTDGSTASAEEDSGCGCRTEPRTEGRAWVFVALAGLLLSRKSRRN